MVTMLLIKHTHREHQSTAREADANNCGKRAGDTAKTVSDENGHVCRVQPRQGLTDRQQLDKSLIVQPRALCDQRVSQVGDDTTSKAGGTDQQELQEDLKNGCRFSQGTLAGGGVFLNGRLQRCAHSWTSI